MTVLSDYFSNHLKELRQRLIISFCAIVLLSLIAYAFSEHIVRILTVPLFQAHQDLDGLVYTNLTEAFISYLKVSLLAGIIFSFPVLCYEVWMFVAPGLHSNEKKVARNVVFWASLLFAIGACFAYFIVIPKALSFFMGVGQGQLEPLPKIESYLTFIARACLTFGLAFEIPFLMVAAAKVGLVKKDNFTAKRKYYYLAILVLSFLLTVGDVFAAVLLAFPLFGLYEMGIFVMRLFLRAPAKEPAD